MDGRKEGREELRSNEYPRIVTVGMVMPGANTVLQTETDWTKDQHTPLKHI